MLQTLWETAYMATKNKMSRVYRLFFGGSDRANRQVSKGRGKVLKRGTHGYGAVRGDAVGGTQERLK